jgi:hypothetical protein
VVEDRPIKVEYSLTEAGTSLETTVDDFRDWKHESLTYLEEVAADPEADGGGDGDGDGDDHGGVAAATDR